MSWDANGSPLEDETPRVEKVLFTPRVVMRPRKFRRFARRVWLFLRIVWREWEPGYRLDAALSWEVAGIVWSQQ